MATNRSGKSGRKSKPSPPRPKPGPRKKKTAKKKGTKATHGAKKKKKAGKKPVRKKTAKKTTKAKRATKKGKRPPGKPRVPKKPQRVSSTPNRGSTKSGLPRLQKVLAANGIASRRDCETLIEEGRVEIDGKVVSELGVRVDPDRQVIRVDGDVLKVVQRIYYLVNKPEGVVSTNRDQSGRMRVIDLVPDGDRLFTVGRLDMSSEGLMLVTNDGELANKLAHPRYGIEKTYLVTVQGHPTPESLKKLRRGIHLAEGVVRVQKLRVKSRQKNTSVLEMVLTEGRNREIRRMAARIDHKVLALKRVGLGALRLGDVPSGAYRLLTSQEIRRLHDLTSGGSKSKRPARKKSPPKKNPAGNRYGKKPAKGKKQGKSKCGSGGTSRRLGRIIGAE